MEGATAHKIFSSLLKFNSVSFYEIHNRNLTFELFKLMLRYPTQDNLPKNKKVIKKYKSNKKIKKNEINISAYILNIYD